MLSLCYWYVNNIPTTTIYTLNIFCIKTSEYAFQIHDWLYSC